MIRQEKETKGIQIGKEEVKLSLFADDMTVYIKNHILHQKVLNLKSEFGKTVEHEVNIQKSKAFLYTNNEISNRNQGKIPLDIGMRKIKCLGINLTN